MIRGVFILTAAGNILFEKVWAPIPVLDTKKTIVSALLTTLHVLAGSATGGMHLSHITLTTLGITVASDARNELKCFLIHDEDADNELGNYEFGRLVAVRILSSFTDNYMSKAPVSATFNKASYASFSGKLLEVISGADKDILRELRCTPGVNNCVVVFDTSGASNTAALGHQTTVAASEIEEIGFLANFRSFMAYSEELMLSASDRGVFACVDTPRERITISRLTFGSLVVVSSKNKDFTAIMPQVTKAVYHLEKLNMFLAAVKGT